MKYEIPVNMMKVESMTVCSLVSVDYHLVVDLLY